MDRREAEAIYDAGREVVVEVLLRMDRQIQQLAARVDRLEHELRKNSRNSSLPPSSDPPGKASSKRGKGRSPRQQGAQPGHEGKGRELLPAWAVDEVVEHWPERCGCGHVFSEAERVVVRWIVNTATNPIYQARKAWSSTDKHRYAWVYRATKHN